MQTDIFDGYQELANAIVARAAEDYRNALNGISYNTYSPETIIKRLEKFFRSSWFRTLTKVNGEYLIEQLKQEHNEQERSNDESNINSSNT